MSRKHRLLCTVFPVALLVLPFFVGAIPVESPSNEDPEAENPVSRFRKYLSINTAHPNPDYSVAVSFLRSLAESLPLHTRVFEFVPNKPVLLLIWEGSDPSLPSVLLNSHMDSVPAEPSKWTFDPFSAVRTSDGKIFARGAQDDKCIGIQYIEAIRNLWKKGFTPLRTLIVSYVPDEEIGGLDGVTKFVASKEFEELNVGFMLDEGQASTTDEFRVFYSDRTPWDLIIKAQGAPGHGSKMYDNSAMENLIKSMEIISKFRETQFDKVKAGVAVYSEVISVNPVYMKAGTPSPSVSFSGATYVFSICFMPTKKMRYEL
ncbi:hypothetical protein MLD38_013035 [Melastoma candidum]|uniref:Uncharacterized protein n=1 Tax=Melastoma candidum TaxID=119954 RepID=A0ACB9RGQ7_9MYRT|nr:hypothetical protein MLD38_013035 [Melastoma candidum]